MAFQIFQILTNPDRFFSNVFDGGSPPKIDEKSEQDEE